MYETKRFNSISIRLASPEAIKMWSHGEVKKPETINYRTQKPEPDGLFCEKIFGPTKSWECHCGKYKKIRYKGMTCEKCGVDITKNTVRRERMGHIELAAPVSHIWYFRGVPSRISLILDLKPKQLEKVLYFAAYIVLDKGETDLEEKQIIDESQYRDYCAKYGKNKFVAKMGAEAIKELLHRIDINKLCDDLNEQRKQASGQKKVRIIKQLEVAEAFRTSGNKPEWMILDVLPVLPPELRPMVPLDGGRYATSDLNDLYRRVINRNNRLKKLLEIGAPDIIIRNEKRMLQEAVDALIDNGRRGRAVTGSTSATSNRNLKSLTDLLKGKQGRFRQNLLGKRVDYSGRSVIVVGPELKMWQCGLPKEMALELFKPFVIKKLVEEGLTQNIKTGRRMVDRGGPEVWDILEDIIKDHPVMLNRAPTLHRLGIQAFEPILVEGRAIKLHPLVCTGFNADFDGDQMAVHVPLSAEAQAEARFLMLSTNNLLKPQDGKPVTIPTQDMILGCYYITMLREGAKGEGMVFTSIDEAFMAYDEGHITLQTKIGIRLEREIDGKKIHKVVYSGFGRFIFNQIIPQNLGYVDRTDSDKLLDLECDFQVGKKQLGDIIARCIDINGQEVTVELLDNVKSMGYHYSTIGGISIGIGDMIVPEVKDKMIAEADKKVEDITRKYQRGFLNNDGRYKEVVKVWTDTTAAITEELKKNLKSDNPIQMMAHSGARGDINQIKQLAGMRGTFTDTSGKAIEIPIKSNLREGMNVLEFFISSHGARKALSDTALKTANSGYLTRRLVDVAQQVIISEEDCGTDDFTWVKEITNISNGKETVIKSLSERLAGRYAAEDICDPTTGEVLVKRNELITNLMAKKIEDVGNKKVKIRTAFDCKSRRGICSKCYGLNLATGRPTTGGEVVGIMAAQSIGEPGTQLTMRTFHTGGIATGEDITTGLPRVEEIFENQSPKGEAIISEIDGTVRIEEDEKTGKRVIVVTPDLNIMTVDEEGNEVPEVERRYPVNRHATISIKDGDVVEKADKLTDGPVNLNDIMKLKGERGVEKYVVSEVIKVYKAGGIAVSDKHIEIITRQMLRRVKIEDAGDSDFMIGTTVDIYDYEEKRKEMIEKGLTPPTGVRNVLGISKASISADSFLSAASFQESAKVLTEAAVKGKTDPLVGLKENIMIGNLIPAGTGMTRYHDITAVPVIKQNAKIITGSEYDENSENAAMFENDYLDEVTRINQMLDDAEAVTVTEEENN